MAGDRSKLPKMPRRSATSAEVRLRAFLSLIAKMTSPGRKPALKAGELGNGYTTTVGPPAPCWAIVMPTP